MAALELLLALLLAAPSRAQLSPGAPVLVEDFSSASGGYLDPEQLPVVQAFPAAPAPGSEVDRADLAALRGWQGRRTPAECARAQAETSPSYDNFFGTLSPFPRPLPDRAQVFFSLIAADAGAANQILKRRYQRLRPFLRDAALKPCITKPKGFSYPSGHATVAYLYGLVLSDLVPARRAAFLARGAEGGLDRVIGGVHHPSDVAASKVLAEGLHEALQGVPAYRKELEALRRLLKP